MMRPNDQYNQWRAAGPTTAQAGPRATGSTLTQRRPLAWLRWTSWGWNRPLPTISDRELARRSRLLSWILLAILIVLAILAPLGASDVGSLAAILGVAVGVLIGIFLNRAGQVTAAGALLIVLITAGVMGSIVTYPLGLGIDSFPAYDILLITVVVAASVLPRGAAFVVAGVNVALIIGDFFLQPHFANLNEVLNDPRLYGDPTTATISLLARPVALQIIIATVAFLWVSGTNEAIRRADRAEEIASLEHTLADQKRQLDIGIQQILQTHVRAANGDYTARAPLGQDNILWQIASSLNNLLSRLQRSGQAEHQLTRTNEELRRLAAAIDDAQAGRKPIWPAPTGTAADLILERIRGGRRSAPQPLVQEQPGPSQPMSGFPGGPRSAWPDAMAQQMPPAQRGAAGWPDQMASPPQQMEPAQNGGWPGQQGAQQSDGWPAPAESPLGDQGGQDANPWAFPQDER